jgi:hypothetical protein
MRWKSASPNGSTLIWSVAAVADKILALTRSLSRHRLYSPDTTGLSDDGGGAG